MKAMYDYQLLIQAITLGFAIFWTLTFIGKSLTFYIKGMRGEATKIFNKFPFMVAISWAIYFWLMKAQF